MLRPSALSTTLLSPRRVPLRRVRFSVRSRGLYARQARSCRGRSRAAPAHARTPSTLCVWTVGGRLVVPLHAPGRLISLVICARRMSLRYRLTCALEEGEHALPHAAARALCLSLARSLSVLVGRPSIAAPSSCLQVSLSLTHTHCTPAARPPNPPPLGRWWRGRTRPAVLPPPPEHARRALIIVRIGLGPFPTARLHKLGSTGRVDGARGLRTVRHSRRLTAARTGRAGRRRRRRPRHRPPPRAAGNPCTRRAGRSARA